MSENTSVSENLYEKRMAAIKVYEVKRTLSGEDIKSKQIQG
ncbi:MAG: hypothetical protein AB2L14_13545 [Candidatus Xenobiia bacterium LiM19]